MNVLFVCKHNRFRSKVAEAFAKKYIRGINVKSAGVQLDILRPFVAESVHQVLEDKKIKIEDERSRQITEQDIE